jgi:LysR family transcriptional regulator, nitrogen assimilation regulatory protein
MDLERLRLFVRVAELGSLTKAAATLNMVQPVISRRIVSLEKTVGGQLFQRTGRGVVLSPLGRMLLPRARALIQEADQLLDDARAANNEPAGEVRIGLLASFMSPLVGLLLRRTLDTCPKIKLKTFEGTIGRLDEWLQEGRIDIAVSLRDSHHDTAEGAAVASVDTYLVGKPGDPLLQNGSVEFAVLEGLPIILTARTSGLQKTIEQIADQRGITLNPVIETDSLSLHLELAINGFGYAILTPGVVARDIREGRLASARITEPRIVRTITVGTSVRHSPSRAVRQVNTLISEIIGELISTGRLPQVE